MIAQLSGKIVFKSPTQSVIDCGGVGYEVLHTPFTAEKISGESASIFIHTVVREDALQLFGFYTMEERAVFRELLKVSGVGPKLAISIMSGIPAQELLEALSKKDASRLQKIPGIGKKTADRLVVELSDRLAKFPLTLSSAQSFNSGSSRESEIESVLLNLGYQRSEISHAVKSVRSKQSAFETETLESLVKATLRELTQVKSL